MTHPLLTAIDVALAKYGWIDGVEYLHITGPTQWRPHPSASVYLVGEPLKAHAAPLLAEAYEKAVLARDERLALRRDEAAKAALRTLAANAGIDPDLVKG